ncbi:CD276 antigen-like [Lithobates pipiens]
MSSLMLAVLMFLIQGLQGLKECPKQEQNITVKLGDTAHLPCSFSSPKGVNKRGVQVSWQKEHTEIDLVVHFQNGKEEGDQQNERFIGRTLVGRTWYQDGNAKLSLHRVTKEDTGKYTCWITLLPLKPWSQHRCCVVTLTISEDKPQEVIVKGDRILSNFVIMWAVVFFIIGLLAIIPCLLTSRPNYSLPPD